LICGRVVSILWELGARGARGACGAVLSLHMDCGAMVYASG
jgi:hypothetical protein